MVYKIRDVVLADRQLKLKDLGDTTGISKDCVWGMKKLSERWVLRLFGGVCAQPNPRDFFVRFVTVDECTSVNAPVHTGDQSSGLFRASQPRRRQGRSIDRKGNGHHFLGLSRCDSMQY